MFKKYKTAKRQMYHNILENIIACHVLGGHDTTINACCLFDLTGVFSRSASNFNSWNRTCLVRCNAVLGRKGHTVCLQISFSDLMANLYLDIFTHCNFNDKLTHRTIPINFRNILECRCAVLDGDNLVFYHITIVEKRGD